MSENFIFDLNEYFKKKYENYEMISSMPSYESVTMSMILKNINRIEEGEVASNEMRKIVHQPKADAVLAEIKEKYVDDNFTFSVFVAPRKTRLKAFFAPKSTGGAKIAQIISKYGEDVDAFYEKLGIDAKIWKRVIRGTLIPEKVLIFKISLILGLTQEDNLELMKI